MKSQLGSDEMIANFQRRLQDAIEAKLPIFLDANKQKHKGFIVSVKHCVVCLCFVYVLFAFESIRID